MSVAVPFPEDLPPGYAWFDDEPAFDPGRHLQLEAPTKTLSLTDLGYADEEIATKATTFAVSSPFRVLSEEGAAVMLDVARRLRAHTRRAGDRIERVMRGGCYRSRWLRDLCVSPDVTEMMSTIYATPVAPHSMPLHLGHLNYEPTDFSQAVDKWHHDTLPLDYVLMVSDPATLTGGGFEWFRGTKAEMTELGGKPPADRVETPTFPGPGYAIALHGDMVIHRAAGLEEPGERMTMVNGYVALDTTVDEQSRTQDLIEVDDQNVLYAEWARHVAWRGMGRLHAVIDEVAFGDDPAEVRDRLVAAIADVNQAIAEMVPEDGPVPTFHYEK
ncbi:MAG: hypothetical protein AAF548_10595 [Actinomycetota bacterium]